MPFGEWKNIGPIFLLKTLYLFSFLDPSACLKENTLSKITKKKKTTKKEMCFFLPFTLWI